MARRGERIGDAYIEIHADGDRIYKQVPQDFRNAGEESAKTFSQGFRNKIRDFAFGRELGNREGRSFSNAFGETAQAGFRGTMNRFGREIFAARKFAIMGRDAGRGFALTFGRELFALRNAGAAIGRAFNSVEDAIGGEVTPSLRGLNNNFERLRRTSQRTTAALNEGLFDFSGRLRTVGGDLEVFRDRTHHYADAFGRAFGRGARNDFINFIGAFVRGTLLATAGAARLTLATVQGFGRLGEAFAAGSAGGGFLSGLRAMGTEIAAMFPRVAALVTSPAGLAGLAAGLTTLLIVLQSVISLFISLGGAVTALAVTIGSALVGGLTILAALLVPITAGIGGLVASILLMDDATKKTLRESIQPFIDQMKVLAQITGEEAFRGLAEDAKSLGTIFKDPVFQNFARDVGIGLRQVREEFIAAFDTKRFRDFFEFMGPKVREQLLSLTEIFIQLGSGIGGVFIAATPAVDRFLSRLDGVTARFAEFANSVRGRAALTDFFSKAEVALASIGRLTVSVGKSFALMFRLGAGEAGVRLIDGLRQKFEQFSAFMKANPDVIRRFFGDAAAVTEAVGRALLGIIRIFDALDTHTSRQGVVAFFSLMGDTLNVLGGIIAFVTQQFDVLGSKFSIFGAAFDFVTTAIPGLNGLKTATEGLGKTYGDTANTVNKTKIAPLLNTAPLLQATETIRLTDKEMKALNKQFGIPLPKPQVDVSPLDSAIGKIRELTQSSLDLASTLDPSNGLGGLTVFLSNLQSGLGGLTKGGGVQVPVKPTTDPAALSTVQGQITTAVSAAPAPIKPTLAPGSTQAIKASLDTLKTNNVIPITAGGNAQAVIARTKTALTGLMRTKASLVITAGGNAQAVIARTRAALTSLMSARKNLVITAGGNAQAVIARTQAALNKLIKPVKIDISAGGNAQSVISRTKSALADLPSSKTITIKVTKTGSGASLVARGAILMAEGGVIQSMASGGFANFRQFIRPDVIAGEAGREAVVPLDRPLGQVDPAVRELAAFAQGKFDALLSNAVAKQGINASGWTIVTPTTDPAAVADEVFNRLAAMSY